MKKNEVSSNENSYFIPIHGYILKKDYDNPFASKEIILGYDEEKDIWIAEECTVFRYPKYKEWGDK